MQFAAQALDVTLRDNDFTNSAYAGGVATYSCPRLCATEKIKDIIYSGRLVIEGNLFSQAEKRTLQVSNAAEVVLKNNTFKQDESLPSHAPNGESGIAVDHCGKVEIEDVKII